MKKLILLCIFAMLISCKDREIPDNHYIDGATLFVVTDIIRDKSLVNMDIYYVEIIDLNGFSSDGNGRNLNLKFTAEKGKYKLGQPINF